jgi:hypothetical protein
MVSENPKRPITGDDEISKLLKSSALLPGEPAEVYLKGLRGAVEELGAKTELQKYLAVKIFECLWWIRRYETQKRSTILSSMVSALSGVGVTPSQKHAFTALIEGGHWADKGLLSVMKDKGFTQESLLSHAMSDCHDELFRLDQQIALRTKTLHQFQQSFEALVNRTLVQDRLKLQNLLLRRDVGSIAIEPGTDQSDLGNR